MRKITLLIASLLFTVGAMAQFELSTGVYYKIKNVTADKYLQIVGNNTNLKLSNEDGTIFQLEDVGDGKFYIKSFYGKDNNYYIQASDWNFTATTTANNKTPYTIDHVDNEAENVYSLYQNTATYTGYAGADSQEAGASIYCNKTVAQNGKWAFEAVEYPKEITTSKQYRLKSAYGGLYMECVDFAKTGGEGAFQFKNKSANSGQIFELETATDGKYYLKTKQNETAYYVKAASWNFYAGKEAETAFTIDLVNEEWPIYSLYQDVANHQGYAGNINEVTDGTYIYNNQPNLTKNTIWFFEEVNDVVVSITYIYKWNGTEVARETVDGIIGADYPVYTSVPFGFTAVAQEGTVLEEKTIDVALEYNLPFEYAASVNEISKWYFLKMHCNYSSYIQDNESGTLPYINGNSVATDNTRNRYAWAFVGDPINGFKVVNKATGKAITSNGDGDATTAEVESATKWLVKASTERPNNASFFTLKYPTNDNYLNANAPAGKIQHWNKADGGSTINVEAYTPQANETQAWAATNLEMWGDALAVADYPAVAVNEGANGNDVHRATKEVTLTGARKITATFRYSSGNCALKILGVDIVDANNNVIAGDYHSGSTGTNSNNNVYTMNVADAGTYTMRFYVWTNEKERLNDTNGNITIVFEEVATSEFSKAITFAAEYATLHLGYKVAIPTGVEAYVVSSIENGSAIITQVEGVIPAAVPVILKNVGNESSYTFSYTANDVATIEKNLLKGSITNCFVSENAYVLGMINVAEEGEEERLEVGLGKAKQNQLDNTAFLNNANKAYLPATDGMNAVAYSFRNADVDGDDDATAIEEVETENAEVVIYDLAGRRINEITEGGIYIIGGRKVLVK